MLFRYVWEYLLFVFDDVMILEEEFVFLFDYNKFLNLDLWYD